MAEKTNENIATSIQLQGIELLKGSLELPNAVNGVVNNFNFDINIENKIDPTNKLIFVIVNINVKGDDATLTLGALSVSCIFHLLNFDEIIKPNTEGKFDVPTQINEVLNSISVSTTRGIMFSTFKGTLLHNAFLPIIDPRQFQTLNPKG